MTESQDRMSQQDYHEERKILIDAEREAARSLDKAMITLSAGALALSITLVRDIASHPASKWLMFVAWGLFVGALVTTLVSFLCSQSGMRRQREIIDAYRLGREGAREQKNPWRTLINWLNWISVVCFIAGVISFACFAAINFPGKGK